MYFYKVNKIFKISIVLSISILYCFILSIYGGNVSNSYAISSRSTDAEFYSPILSSSLFCHTEQTESPASVYHNRLRTTVKNSFNQFSACPIAVGKLLFNKYLPYLYYAKNIVIGFKPTDIIFPFQYFW